VARRAGGTNAPVTQDRSEWEVLDKEEKIPVEVSGILGA
jgi:hypothetical protein